MFFPINRSKQQHYGYSSTKRWRETQIEQAPPDIGSKQLKEKNPQPITPGKMKDSIVSSKSVNHLIKR